MVAQTAWASDAQNIAEELLAVDGCWKSVFLRKVATGRFPMLWWMTPKPM